MKILSLKALNINSLKGTTEIDFAELTKSSALFAITGATGSGKSTLLDIISCALYGRTARLKNPNDLMSRQAGEAYCEVEFEIRGKVYRSSWTQKRARKKHDGTFQTAKMELVDVDENKIISQKSREVPKKVEELSGLDFGRFTQSMLLAQGGFDAFLKADEKERSALLEKITGTQIYAEISKAIFEKHRNLQQEIDSDEKILESIELLKPEIFEDIQQQLSQNISQKNVTDKELKELTVVHNWLQKGEELQEESQKYNRDFLEVTMLKEENKKSFEKLDLATRAMNISSTFNTHSELQETLLRDKKSATTLSKEIAHLHEDIEQKERAYSSLKKVLSKESSLFSEENEKIKKARELLTQEKERQRTLTKEEDLLKSKKDDFAKMHEDFAKTLQEHNQIETEIKNQKSYLLTHSKDAKLLEIIGIVEQNIIEYKKEEESFKETTSRLLTSKDTLFRQEKNYTLKKEEVQRVLAIYTERVTAYKKLEKSTLHDMKREEETQKDLEETLSLLNILERYSQGVLKRAKELDEYAKRSDLIDSLEKSKELSKVSIETVKKYITTLREKQEQEQLLQKYEEDRKRLVTGEPCALCGSLKHPFAENLPNTDPHKSKEIILSQLQELETHESSLRELELRLGVQTSRQESSKLEIEKLDVEIETLRSENSKTELEEKEALLTQKLHTIKQNRLKKEELLKLRESVSSELQSEEKALYKVQSRVEKLRAENEQLLLSTTTHEAKMKELLKRLEEQFREFGVTIDLQRVDAQYKELLEKKELYAQTQETLQLHETKWNECKIKKKESETKVGAIDREITKIQTDIKELEEKRKELSSKRIQIVNVADLDAYEKEIKSTYSKLQEEEKLSQIALNASQVKSQERVTQKKSLDLKILEDEKKLKLLNERLEELYLQNEFKDSDSFQNALLDKREREELAHLCKEIEDRYKQAQTLQRQTVEKLQEHEKKALSQRAKEEVETLQSLLEQKVNALQESIGSDKKELALNQENSNKFQKKIASLEKKKDALRVWVKLNELVGSADGVKFKKFAQGITLDQLINLANKHLSILSSRYILSRNQEKLLELEIIDAYQGDVLRPVSTLSGGEGFIVSLALALGLSELASQKISIDSLFLDEGFGTLDEESLETALNALNLLQGGGKMVGVISHVETLKERIPLQIKLTPRGDGTSYVQIQGV